MRHLTRLILLFSLMSFHVWAESQILTIIPELSDGFERNYNPFDIDPLAITQDFTFEPLVIFMNGKPVFRLASGYRLDKDLRGITLTLRDNVKWSDGETFSANDVLFSMELTRRFPELDFNSINKWIADVEKRGSHEIYIKLTAPNSLMPQLLSSIAIVPEHQWKNISDPINFTNPDPVGTGPFTRIESFSDKEIIQCRNPHYWQQEELDIDCIRFPRVETNDRLISYLHQGEFDWASSFIPDIERNYASYSPNFHYQHQPATIVNLVFNFRHENPEIQALINSRNFRRAISMTLQRDLLVDIALFGQGEKAMFASGMEHRFAGWTDRAIAEQNLFFIRHHPDTAERLFDELGMTDRDEDGYRKLPSGEQFELSIISPDGWTDFNSVAELVAEMLSTKGIRVVAEPVPFGLYQHKMAVADYSMAITNYPAGTTPFRYFDSGFNSNYQTPQSPRYAQHYYTNQIIDERLDQFLLAESKEQQRRIINDIQIIVAKNQIVVPLYHTVNTIEYNTSRFTGWYKSKPGESGIPTIWPNGRQRLLQLLDLKPVPPVQGSSKKSAEKEPLEELYQSDLTPEGEPQAGSSN